MIKYIRIFIVLTSLYLASCANVKPPAGGPKDETPPKLVTNSCTPNPLTRTNYSLNYIELVFDEYIKENNLMSELNITPSLKGSYVYDAYKYKLKIEFGEPLDSNTTYTFNFGKGVVDVTENNPAENLIFSFSTGDKMDSLEIGGQIVDNLTNKPQENILVCLYAKNDTLTPSNSKPNYSVYTDSFGRYFFQNLKQDEYNIYALQDNNGDYMYQPNIDKIGLLEESVQLSENIYNLDLRLFSEDKMSLQLDYIKNKNKYVNLEFNKTIFDIDLTSNTSFNYFFLNPNKSIRLYNTAEVKDSLKINVTAIDSIDQKIDTTVVIMFPNPKKVITAKASQKLITDEKGFSKDLFETSVLFNKPIKTFFPDSILIAQKDTLPITKDADIVYTWNKYKTKLTISRTNNNDPITIIVKKGTFITCENDTLATAQIQSKLLTDNNYALLEGKIITQKPNYTVELIDENLQVINSMTNTQSFSISYLKAGTYSFRVLIDDNSNGVYDNGDYEKNTVPETIYFYPEAIKLKANWEISDIRLEF